MSAVAVGPELPPDVERQLDDLPPVEIAIGVLTYNNAATIPTIVDAVRGGLDKHLTGTPAVLINADAGSSDSTVERLAESGLTQTVEIPDNLPLLRADERKTMQMVLNLTTNAIKFSREGGEIAIVCRADAQRGLSITVADTGVGIAPEDIGRVLEAFEQVDNSLSRRHQGTGLGLPLVKAMVELHGGKLELTSEPGVGTQATIVFPPERLHAAPPAKSVGIAA